jgi:hypothetical protein
MLNMSTDGTVDEQNVFRCAIAVIECFVISFTETLSERLANANIDLYKDDWRELKVGCAPSSSSNSDLAF